MPRYLAALLFAASLLFSTGAQATCNGQFPANTVCGNPTGSTGNPNPVPLSSFSVLFANPTAHVGLSTVNGSATTAMRSDASPPLDQSISPTWTGTHTFTNSLLRLLGSSTGHTTFTSANGGSSNFTLTFPAVTDTLAVLGTAQTWTALQKYTNGDLGLLGSSTGYTLLESGLSGAGNNTLTLPTTSSDTLAALGTAQTWSALQQFNDGDFVLKGSASGTLVQHAAAAAGSSVLTWPAGTTDFTATGSAHYVVRQSSAGSALTVGQLACSDLSDSVSGCSGTASSITVGNPVIGGTNSYLLGISSGGNLASQQFATLAQGGLGGDQSAATANSIPVYPGSGGAAVPTTLASIFASPPPIGGTAPNTGKFSYLLTAPSGSTSGGAYEYPPLSFEVWSGSSASRITTPQTPTVSISRFESISSGVDANGANGPALWINNIASGSHQNVGLTSFVLNTVGSTVALYGVATASASGQASYGGFLNAITIGAADAVALETNTQNDTGGFVPYNPIPGAAQQLVALDLPMNSTTGTPHGGGVAIQIRGSGVPWDVGIGFMTGNFINTANFQDNSQAPTIYLDKGTHTNGFDLTGGTYSGNPFASTGFNVNAAGDTTAPYFNASAITSSAGYKLNGVTSVWVSGNYLTLSDPAAAYFLSGSNANGIYFDTAPTFNIRHSNHVAVAFTVTTNSTAASSNTAVAGTLTVSGITADTGHTDATVCEDTTSHQFYSGTGTLGICLGTSGRQFKTAFAPMTAGLDQIMALPLLNYRYRHGYGDNGLREQYGLVAQDVATVMPDLVGRDSNGDIINYDAGALLFVSMRAIQQLKADNDNLHQEIKELKLAQENRQ